MAGPAFMPGAERLTPSAGGGTSIDFPSAGPHMIWHTTEFPSGGDGFAAMDRVLVTKSAEPTFLADPLTDRVGQYFPAPQTGRALPNDMGLRANRVGTPCLQIEVVGYAARPFTRTWEPGPKWRALGTFLEEWGVPWTWPSGNPPSANIDERSPDIYYAKGGHYGHSQAPCRGADQHWDPGGISTAELFRGLGRDSKDENREAPGVPGSIVWPGWSLYPGRKQLGFGEGQRSKSNALVASALAVRGYDEVVVDQTWQRTDHTALLDFKARHDITERGVGPLTWSALGRLKKAATTPDFPGSDNFVVDRSSEESRQFQALMVLQGFGDVLGWKSTRKWRNDARRATRRFQLSERRLKADPDGVPGPLTWLLAYTDND